MSYVGQYKQVRLTRQINTDRKNRCALFTSGYLQRVCQAWRETREVEILSPGIRRAEG